MDPEKEMEYDEAYDWNEKEAKDCTRKKTKKKKKSIFHGQVNCLCNRKCAQAIDIVTQQELFEKFTKLETWSTQTTFLRAHFNKKNQRKCRSNHSN